VTDGTTVAHICAEARLSDRRELQLVPQGSCFFTALTALYYIVINTGSDKCDPNLGNVL